jgi:hypothetical protein
LGFSLWVMVAATVAEVSASVVEDREVLLTASDAGGSGVLSVEYRLGDGPWLAYTGPFTVDGAAQTVSYRATDRAGNLSEVGSLEIEAAPETGPGPAPQATTIPSVAGTARVGRSLTASPGVWDMPGLTLRYQWLRNGAPIAGATGRVYRLRPVDRQGRISVQVSATRAGHATGVAASSTTTPVRRALARVRTQVRPGVMRAGDRMRVRVRVRVPGYGLVPRGRVDVFYQGQRVRTVRLNPQGRAVTRVRARAGGRQVVRVVYRGTPGIRKAAQHTPIRVR